MSGHRQSPYDWGGEREETELERFRRTGHGNGSPLSRGEFYAVHEAHLLIEERRDARIQALEDKIYAPKRFLLGLLWSGWGRLLILITAFITGILLTEYHDHFHWWP